jgi:hypothetical protein
MCRLISLDSFFGQAQSKLRVHQQETPQGPNEAVAATAGSKALAKLVAVAPSADAEQGAYINSVVCSYSNLVDECLKLTAEISRRCGMPAPGAGTALSRTSSTLINPTTVYEHNTAKETWNIFQGLFSAVSKVSVKYFSLFIVTDSDEMRTDISRS